MEYVIECHPLEWPKNFDLLKKTHFQNNERIKAISHEGNYHYVSTDLFFLKETNHDSNPRL